MHHFSLCKKNDHVLLWLWQFFAKLIIHVLLSTTSSQRDAVAENSVRSEGQHIFVRSIVAESVRNKSFHTITIRFTTNPSYNIFHPNFSPSNPIRRNTTRARGRSYKKDKVNSQHRPHYGLRAPIGIHSFRVPFQHAIVTVPNTPNAHSILPNAFRFDQAQLKKQHTIF